MKLLITIACLLVITAAAIWDRALTRQRRDNELRQWDAILALSRALSLNSSNDLRLTISVEQIAELLTTNTLLLRLEWRTNDVMDAVPLPAPPRLRTAQPNL